LCCAGGGSAHLDAKVVRAGFADWTMQMMLTGTSLFKQSARSLLAVFGILLLAACAGAPASQPLRLNPAPWSDRERSTFRISTEGDFVGTAEFLTTREDERGQEWTVRRDLTGRGDQEIVLVTMSDAGLRPVESTLVRILPAGVEQV